MDQLLSILAATRTAFERAQNAPIVPINDMWQHLITITWFQAVISISLGLVYLMYGWRIFKMLVVICFGIIGLFIGIRVGTQYQHEIWGGIIGLFALAAISIPLMKWAVSLLSAAAGGILTAGIWYAADLPEKYIMAGAMIGIVAGFMISFIVLKVAVMLFSSLGGGAFIMSGLLSLLYQYENIQDPPTAHLHEWFYTYHWFIPVVLMIPTAIGMIVQNKLIKTSSGWSL
jgi:hypothetical protein